MEKRDLRYGLTYIGDIFVDAVRQTADVALLCSRAAFSTYDIQQIQCKKNKVAREVGERLSVLAKEGTADVTKDAVLVEIIGKLKNIEKELTVQESTRTNLMQTLKGNLACECTPTQKGKE